jgi:S1-C subfamily serine protease
VSATQVLELVQRVVKRLDGDQEKLAYIRVAEPPRPVSGAGGGGYGAYFGSIPDMGESQNGVKFSDVRPGSPADQAGLKGGDVLVAFDNDAINNLEDFTFQLRKRKPGDKVKATVMRGKEKMIVDVTLGKRQ